jgi:hypothetical protein
MFAGRETPFLCLLVLAGCPEPQIAGVPPQSMSQFGHEPMEIQCADLGYNCP